MFQNDLDPKKKVIDEHGYGKVAKQKKWYVND